VVWDKVTKSADIMKTKKKTVITHVINESPISIIKNRDLIDKRFKFVHDRAIYVYRSSASQEVFPPNKDLERLELIFTLCKYSIQTN
jgi:hypothetical protein